MDKNNKIFWIIGIILIVLFISNSGKKEALSNTIVGSSFDVDILDYKVNSGYVDAEVMVSNRNSEDGKMFVEAGVYTLEDNAWLNTFKKQSIFGTQLLAYNCVPNQPNVQDYLVGLNGKDSLLGGDMESLNFHLQIPSRSGTLVLFTEAFRQCASEGDPMISDFDLITLTSTTGGTTPKTCPSGQTACSDGVCRINCNTDGNLGGTTGGTTGGKLCPDGSEAQFYQDSKNNCKTATWVWLVAGLFGFFMFMSMLK